MGDQLGAIAKPDEIRFADNLPKTRSGKIMRRLLRSIARGEEITQDISTLENPNILDMLRGLPGGSAPKTSKAKPKPKPKVKAKPKAKPKVKPRAKAKPIPKPRAKKVAVKARINTKAKKQSMSKRPAKKPARRKK